MTTDQFERRALQLFEEALARPEAEQEAYVIAATPDDIDLLVLRGDIREAARLAGN